MIKSTITNNDEWSVRGGKELENSECTQRATRSEAVKWRTHRLELVLMHLKKHTYDERCSEVLYSTTVEPPARPAMDQTVVQHKRTWLMDQTDTSHTQSKSNEQPLSSFLFHQHKSWKIGAKTNLKISLTAIWIFRHLTLLFLASTLGCTMLISLSEIKLLQSREGRRRLLCDSICSESHRTVPCPDRKYFTGVRLRFIILYLIRLINCILHLTISQNTRDKTSCTMNMSLAAD